MLKREFSAMGCQMLAALDSYDEHLAWTIEAVPDWFATWERHLSRFNPVSELNRLNATRNEPVPVSPILWDVLHAALAAAEMSAGLVVPTVLDALIAAGYDRSFSPKASKRAPAGFPAVPIPDWRAIRVDANARTVQLPPGLRLDLGGVAKGWGAARAAQLLGTHAPALIDAGGDIAVSGPRADGSPWPVAIASPIDRERDLALLAITSGAVATSGRDYRRWQSCDGTWQHHIIDPRSSQPAASDVLSATVVAPDAVVAEAAAKAVLILGSSAGMEWLEARPSLAGLLVLDDGQIAMSARLERLLWKETNL